MPEPEFYHQRLRGWTTLVTGAGSMGAGFGTGKAIALLFAREGASVVLVDLDPSRAEDTRQRIEADGGAAIVVTGDVTSEDECRRIVNEAVEWGGCLDVLVNNVGLGAAKGPIESLDVPVWRRSVALNFDSAFLMSRAAIPHLLKGRGKAIVNIASVAGLLAHGTSAYGPAKAAMIQFTRELCVIYGKDGLRANAIAPGHIMTPLVEQFASGEARTLRRRIAPLDREGDAWDVAQAALFLAGTESGFITGACLPVDGGVTQVGPLAAFEAASGASATD